MTNLICDVKYSIGKIEDISQDTTRAKIVNIITNFIQRPIPNQPANPITSLIKVSSLQLVKRADVLFMLRTFTLFTVVQLFFIA